LNISRCLGRESTPRPYGRLTHRPATPIHIYLTIYPTMYLSICLSMYVGSISIYYSIYIYSGVYFDIDWEDRKLQVPICIYIYIYIYEYLSIHISLCIYLSIYIYMYTCSISIYPIIYIHIPRLFFRHRLGGPQTAGAIYSYLYVYLPIYLTIDLSVCVSMYVCKLGLRVNSNPLTQTLNP